MGYIRLFIELRDPASRESGARSRIEILDRSDRSGKRYEIKVRLTAWGLKPAERCQVALISAGRGRYKRYVLGELRPGPGGRGEFSFRGIYGALEEEQLGAEYFDAVTVENSSQQLTGFRGETLDWRGLREADEPAGREEAPEEERAVTAEPMPVREEQPPQEEERPQKAERAQAFEKTQMPETPQNFEEIESPVPEQNRERVPSPAPVLKYLFSQHRKVYPFRDVSQRWIRVRPEDLTMLPGEVQKLSASPFVNRAFHRYGYLILGEKGEGAYTVGVPYRYLPALKEEAEAQGFREFRSIRGGDTGYGEYGYWLRNF